jgi:uncharacterized protein YcgL (UPF0745 family)
VHCDIYRALTQPYTYLYVVTGMEPIELPAKLRKQFDFSEVVVSIDLDGRKSLAREDIARVRANLSETGYHLQLPPHDDPSGWLDLPPKKS